MPRYCVDELEYTQGNIGSCFQDGRNLEEPIRGFSIGRMDTLRHPKMKLEVVRKKVCGKERLFSNNNRRLYCMKKYQALAHKQVRVSVKLYDWAPALEY